MGAVVVFIFTPIREVIFGNDQDGSLNSTTDISTSNRIANDPKVFHLKTYEPLEVDSGILVITLITDINFADKLIEIKLVDKKNVVSRDIGFNKWTGLPYRYGDADGETHKIWTWQEIQIRRDPRVFNTGRQIKSGIRINF